MRQPERLIPLRHRFVRATRRWFDERGFCEVETPYCVASPGMEPHLQAFRTSASDVPPDHRRAYLHTSPEYHMKRLLARYDGPIYQVCRCFRDERASRLHHPEFTMLEWYRPNSSYTALMADCESLVAHLAESVLEAPLLRLSEGEVDLDGGCERMTVSQAFERYAGLDPLAYPEVGALIEALLRLGYAVPAQWSWEDVFHYVLLERVEAQLGLPRPTIVHGYPPSLAALSQVVDGLAERFELYIAGHELANAFGELVDAEEQRRRFEVEQAERKRLGRPVYPIDEALLEALDALPPTAGIALGLDRLFLLFAEHVIGERLTLRQALWLDL